MMRVLWFSNTPANSIEYFNSELASTGGWLQSLDQQLQKEVELHVAFYHHRRTSSFSYKDTTYHPLERSNRYIGLLKTRFLNFVQNKEDQETYLRLISEVRPDVVHIHGTENAFGSIVGKTDIPVVTSIQGNITVCRHKFFDGIEPRYLPVRKSRIFDIKTLLLNDSFKSVYKRFGKMGKREINNLKNCKYVIGRTDWDRRITRVMAPSRTYFHNDEVLRDPFYGPSWTPFKRRKIVLHTTSGDRIYKGFETLCLALSELNRLGLFVEWRIAGLSERDLVVKIVKKKLKSCYPAHGVRFLGNLGAGDLVKRLLEADMYIMPTHIENSSNSLCEALIVGMPCIATFAGGTGSLLTDGVDGILIQNGDPWVLAGAILELIENPQKAAQYGLRARARAYRRHNKEKIVTDLLRIYECII